MTSAYNACYEAGNYETWMLTEDGEYFAEYSYECGFYRAEVRWDGCVHLWRSYTTPEPNDDDDYMHICDLGEFIAMLERLKRVQEEKFNAKA